MIVFLRFSKAIIAPAETKANNNDGISLKIKKRTTKKQQTTPNIIIFAMLNINVRNERPITPATNKAINKLVSIIIFFKDNKIQCQLRTYVT